MMQINKNPDLSTFSSYLVKTGLDKVVASSKNFTIWAPTNLALANLDPAIVNDTAQLKKYVSYHISNQSYLTSNANPLLTIRTLNGKNILFTKTKFEEANILIADRYVGNGILHTIDMATVPKLNAWEYLNQSATSLQKTFLISQNYLSFDPTKAEVKGIDPVTGLPIYREGTGYVPKNYFLNQTDISNEDQKYTFIILTDEAFSAEQLKLKKYYTYNRIDTLLTPAMNVLNNILNTDGKTNGAITKDLAFKGDYTIENLPDTLTSNDSVKIHLDKNAIVETHKVSNGVVYVMSRIDYKMSSKIKPVIIQGEYPNANMGSYGTRGTLMSRDPNTAVDFRELYYFNTGKASYWVRYQAYANTVTYKVYWRAIRNFDLTAVAPAVVVMFPQRLAFGTTDLLAAFPYKQVELSTYNEVYLGDYTPTGYGILDTYLVGATTTVNGTNSLVLDYIKMVPILN
jgi:uncharacterized surface protein with fasciclin (FAS1) repeats